MKKLVIIAGILIAATITGCGSDGAVVVEKTDGTWMSMITVQVEHIEVEETLIEETLTEHVLVEDKYIDSEYQSELDYNSKRNNW
jgi:hypothetical protein